MCRTLSCSAQMFIKHVLPLSLIIGKSQLFIIKDRGSISLVCLVLKSVSRLIAWSLDVSFISHLGTTVLAYNLMLYMLAIHVSNNSQSI
jgi:hypothetical protein